MSDAPVEDAPVEDAPVEDAPVEDAPVEDAPVEDASVEDAPVEDAPVEDAPVEDAAAAAPWAAALAERFPDADQRLQVDAFIRAETQPYVTRLEQERADALAAAQQWDELLAELSDDPDATLLLLAEAALGEERARQLADVLGELPEEEPAAEPEALSDEAWLRAFRAEAEAARKAAAEAAREAEAAAAYEEDFAIVAEQAQRAGATINRELFDTVASAYPHLPLDEVYAHYSRLLPAAPTARRPASAPPPVARGSSGGAPATAAGTSLSDIAGLIADGLSG